MNFNVRIASGLAALGEKSENVKVFQNFRLNKISLCLCDDDRWESNTYVTSFLIDIVIDNKSIFSEPIPASLIRDMDAPVYVLDNPVYVKKNSIIKVYFKNNDSTTPLVANYLISLQGTYVLQIPKNYNKMAIYHAAIPTELILVGATAKTTIKVLENFVFDKLSFANIATDLQGYDLDIKIDNRSIFNEPLPLTAFMEQRVYLYWSGYTGQQVKLPYPVPVKKNQLIEISIQNNDFNQIPDNQYIAFHGYESLLPLKRDSFHQKTYTGVFTMPIVAYGERKFNLKVLEDFEIKKFVLSYMPTNYDWNYFLDIRIDNKSIFDSAQSVLQLIKDKNSGFVHFFEEPIFVKRNQMIEVFFKNMTAYDISQTGSDFDPKIHFHGTELR